MVDSLLAEVLKYDIGLRWGCNIFKETIARRIEYTICPSNATLVRRIPRPLQGVKQPTTSLAELWFGMVNGGMLQDNTFQSYISSPFFTLVIKAPPVIYKIKKNKINCLYACFRSKYGDPFLNTLKNPLFFAIWKHFIGEKKTFSFDRT